MVSEPTIVIEGRFRFRCPCGFIVLNAKPNQAIKCFCGKTWQFSVAVKTWELAASTQDAQTEVEDGD